MANSRATRRVGTPQPLFTQGDVDGFFGLAIDNLIQFLLILGLCTAGARLSGRAGAGDHPARRGAVDRDRQLLLRLAGAAPVGRAPAARDVTALPYGINTVSLFAFVLLVMLPVKLAAPRGGHRRAGRGARSPGSSASPPASCRR